MSQGRGQAWESLAAARVALAVRDAELAEADVALAAEIADAHRLAEQYARRLDALTREIDALDHRRTAEGPAAAHEVSRRLLDINREAAAIVTEAHDAASAKHVALQELTHRYR